MGAITIPTERAIGAIPSAWPSLLTREQACAYVGMAVDTFNRLCPVAPLALGARILRWRRTDIDAWVSGLPQRLTHATIHAVGGGQVVAMCAAQIAGEERRFSAVERAKTRVESKRVSGRGR